MAMISARQGENILPSDKIYLDFHVQGCHVLIYPGAFNLTTGPLHWKLLQRSRFVLSNAANEEWF